MMDKSNGDVASDGYHKYKVQFLASNLTDSSSQRSSPCTSKDGRIYLGMHSLIDVVAGIGLGLGIVAFWIMVHEYVDDFIVNGQNGWKSLFPAILLENERIRLLFASGLDMMKQAAEGMTVVQPGTRENISYLRATEQRQFEAQQAALKMHAESMINATLKEKIQDFAESQGVMFAPKDGKLYNNLPVYGFRSINICMDYVKQLVYAQSLGGWVPVSLTQLLQMHHSAVQRY